jgi:anti-sigma-K factor RskA/putative zinc finger protein
MSEHEEMESEIAAWVLGATDPDEAKRIASHVQGCPICRATATRLGWVSDGLALGAEEVEPPARLRQRILDAAAASPHTAPRSTRMEPQVVQIQRPRSRISARLADRVPLYAAAAAVLIALVGGLLVGDLAGRSTSPTPSSQVARFNLAGHDSMAGARAAVIDLKSDGIALVDFSGLPPLVPGKIYEVWLIGPSNRVDAAGVFIPDSSGSKVVVVNKPLAGYATMAVTVEQGPDGVGAPTQQPQLSGAVA